MPKDPMVPMPLPPGEPSRMVEPLGPRLFRRLRRPAANPLPVPTSGEIRGAAERAAAGATAAESFLEVLLAADAAGGEARRLAASLLAHAEPKTWLALDVASRRSWWALPPWWRVATDRAAVGDSALGLVVASFHPDGHVREAAVARLAQSDAPLTGPALALRSADWVPQVRDRARAAVERRLDRSLPDAVLALGPTAFLAARRKGGDWLATTIEQRLRRASPAELAVLLDAPDRLTRRAAHFVAVAERRLDLDDLLARADRENDLPTRLACAQAAIGLARAQQAIDRIASLLGNPSAGVRQIAVPALSEFGDATAAEAGLADRARSVRDTAQRVLRGRGVDPAEAYRSHAAGPTPPPWAIAGLGETGSRQDVPRLEQALVDLRPRVRAHAVRALRRLDAARPDLLLPLLTDASGAVAKQVARALAPAASRLDLTRLRALLAPEEPGHVRAAAYHLLRAHSPWTRLLTDLDLLGDDADPLHARARADILGWLHREAATTYVQPPAGAAAELARAIEARAEALGGPTVEALRFHLGLRPRGTG